MKNRNLNAGDDWKTPSDLYEKLNQEFNFDFDPCPFQHDLNKWDGLKIEWGNSNFVNPPYSKTLKEAFINKALEEARKGKKSSYVIARFYLNKDFSRGNFTELRNTFFARKGKI